MKKHTKQLLAMLLAICALVTFAIPTVFATDSAAAAEPVKYQFYMADYPDEKLADHTAEIKDAYDAGTMNWRYEAASTAYQFRPAGNHSFESGSKSLRFVAGKGQWFALRIKSPGTGRYDLTLNYGVGTVGAQASNIYFVKASEIDNAIGENAASYAQAMSQNPYQENGTTAAFAAYYNAVSTAFAKKTRTFAPSFYSEIKEANVPTTGSFWFEADTEYVMVVELTEQCATSSSAYAYLCSLTAEYSDDQSEPEIEVPGAGEFNFYLPEYAGKYLYHYKDTTPDMSDAIQERYDNGDLNWCRFYNGSWATFESKNSYISFTQTDSQPFILRIKSPGKGTYDIDLNHYVGPGTSSYPAGKYCDIYILPYTEGVTYEEVTDQLQEYQPIMGTSFYGEEVAARTCSGQYTFEKNKEYLVVFFTEDNNESKGAVLQSYISSMNMKKAAPDDSQPEQIPTVGATFNGTQQYISNGQMSASVKTYEATVYFPDSTPDYLKGGVIWSDTSTDWNSVTFEVFRNGAPRLYVSGVPGYEFDKVNLYNGKLTHVAIVVEDTRAVCYIDGVEAQVIEGAIDLKTPGRSFTVGGDRSNNYVEYFKGQLKNVALYADARTAEEVAADVTTLSQEDLLAAYSFTAGAVNPSVLKDLSSNGYDLNYKTVWVEEVEPAFDYAYSMAIIPDTQMTVKYGGSNAFAKIYDWLAANTEKENIQYVIGVGDITDADSDAEWVKAVENHNKLNGIVPYALAMGNHDTAAQMNKYFNNETYTSMLDGTYNGNIENAYTTFTVGTRQYLILILGIGPEDEILNWAGEVIEAHPDHNVIVTTHCYLDSDGTTLERGDGVPATSVGGYNNGQDMWNKLFSKYENISLVVCGHKDTDQIMIRRTEGENGNTVTQLITDFQTEDLIYSGRLGIITMLYFSEDGKDVHVVNYSAKYDKYFMATNQFTTQVDAITPPVCTVTDENGNTTKFESLTDALQAGKGTITLLTDVAFDTLVLNPGMTLDLNGYTLSADVVLVMNGATILDGGAACTGGGLLKVAEMNLGFIRENGQSIIPVWNGVDGYVFTKVTFQQMARTAGAGAAQYIFLPTFSNKTAAALMADGGNDNGLNFKVSLTWNNGQCQQFYTYSDDFVKQVFDGTGRWVFSLTVTGISSITDMVANAVVVTDSGTQAITTGTALTAGQ